MRGCTPSTGGVPSSSCGTSPSAYIRARQSGLSMWRHRGTYQPQPLCFGAAQQPAAHAHRGRPSAAALASIASAAASAAPSLSRHRLQTVQPLSTSRPQAAGVATSATVAATVTTSKPALASSSSAGDALARAKAKLRSQRAAAAAVGNSTLAPAGTTAQVAGLGALRPSSSPAAARVAVASPKGGALSRPARPASSIAAVSAPDRTVPAAIQAPAAQVGTSAAFATHTTSTQPLLLPGSWVPAPRLGLASAAAAAADDGPGGGRASSPASAPSPAAVPVKYSRKASKAAQSALCAALDSPAAPSTTPLPSAAAAGAAAQQPSGPDFGLAGRTAAAAPVAPWLLHEAQVQALEKLFTQPGEDVQGAAAATAASVLTNNSSGSGSASNDSSHSHMPRKSLPALSAPAQAPFAQLPGSGSGTAAAPVLHPDGLTLQPLQPARLNDDIVAALVGKVQGKARTPKQAAAMATASGVAATMAAAAAAALPTRPRRTPPKGKTPVSSEDEETGGHAGLSDAEAWNVLISHHGLQPEVAASLWDALVRGSLKRTIPAVCTMLTRLLRDSTLDKALVLSVLRKQPAMMKQSNAMLMSKHANLVKLLDCDEEAVNKILSCVPSLWGLKIETLREKVAALQGLLQLSKRDVLLLVRRCPNLLASDANTLAEKLKALTSLVVQPHRKVVDMVLQAPTLLFLNRQSMASKFETFRVAMDITAEDLGAMAVAKPQLMTTSTETVTTTWAFIAAAAAKSDKWTKELKCLSPATRCWIALSGRMKLRRLSYLTDTQLCDEIALSSPLNMTPGAFVKRFPGFKKWCLEQGGGSAS